MADDIDEGSAIFIDANIFLYVIFDHWRYAEPCGNLLKDVNSGKRSAVSSIVVLGEVFHRGPGRRGGGEAQKNPRQAVRYFTVNLARGA